MIRGLYGSIASSGSSTAPSPMFNIFGYAMENGTTTGGADHPDTQEYTATNFADFKAACEAAETFHIIIKYDPVGGIAYGNGAEYINIKSNKTILGVTGSVLEGAALMVYGYSNVIIRNMTIGKIQGLSNIIIKEDAHHVWVDHCNLYSDLDSGYDFYDGLLDIGNRASYVTCSWNRMHHNPIPNLIGFSAVIDDSANLKTTLYGNWYHDTWERGPSTLWGEVHLFNNFMQDIQAPSGGYAIACHCGCRMRLENNSMENVFNPYRDNFDPTPEAPIPGENSGWSSTKLVSCGDIFMAGNTNSLYRPPYTYSSYILPVDSVKSIVTTNAGATLNIT